MAYKGFWAAGTSYSQGDTVQWGTDPLMRKSEWPTYIALQASTGQQPDLQPTYWQKMPYSAAVDEFIDGTVTATTTAAPIVSTPTPCSEVLIQCDADSAGELLVGNSTSQSMKLKAGNSEVIPVGDASGIWVKAAASTVTANFHILPKKVSQ